MTRQAWTSHSASCDITRATRTHRQLSLSLTLYFSHCAARTQQKQDSPSQCCCTNSWTGCERVLGNGIQIRLYYTVRPSWPVSQEPTVQTVCGLGKEVDRKETRPSVLGLPWGSQPSQKQIITVIITQFGKAPLKRTPHFTSSSTNISLYAHLRTSKASNTHTHP